MIKINDIHDHQHVDTFFKNLLTSLFWLRYLFQGTVFFLVPPLFRGHLCFGGTEMLRNDLASICVAGCGVLPNVGRGLSVVWGRLNWVANRVCG